MRRQRGAVLLLTVFMLVLAVGVPLVLKLLEAATQKAAQPGAAASQLQVIDDALKAFAATQRRLPCPADGRKPSGGGAGAEARDGKGDCTAQSTGVVPWLTLGLTEAQATDPWGGRLTYRVPTGGPGLTRDGAFDATRCDPLGSNPTLTAATASTAVACAITCTPTMPSGIIDPANCNPPSAFLSGRGLTVQDASGALPRNPALMTGAAYVVISHGPEGGGAFNGSGTLLTSPVAAGSNGEVRNLNNQGIPVAGFFFDATLHTGEGAGAAHFDDRLSYPSLAELLTQTGLAARSH